MRQSLTAVAILLFRLILRGLASQLDFRTYIHTPGACAEASAIHSHSPWSMRRSFCNTHVEHAKKQDALEYASMRQQDDRNAEVMATSQTYQPTSATLQRLRAELVQGKLQTNLVSYPSIATGPQ